MNIKELVNIDLLEKDSLIFTNKLNTEDSLNLLSAISSLANVNGGYIFDGVDNDIITGFTYEEANNERLIFFNMINQNIKPNLDVTAKFIPYTIRKTNRYIIKFHIERSKYLPVVLFYHGVPGIYIRRNGFTNGATVEEIQNLALSSAKFSLLTIYTFFK